MPLFTRISFRASLLIAAFVPLSLFAVSGAAILYVAFAVQFDQRCAFSGAGPFDPRGPGRSRLRGEVVGHANASSAAGRQLGKRQHQRLAVASQLELQVRRAAAIEVRKALARDAGLSIDEG